MMLEYLSIAFVFKLCVLFFDFALFLYLHFFFHGNVLGNCNVFALVPDRRYQSSNLTLS